MDNKTFKYTGKGDFKLNDEMLPVLHGDYQFAFLQNALCWFVIFSNKGLFVFHIMTIAKKVGVEVDMSGLDIVFDPRKWLAKQLDEISKKTDDDILDIILSCKE